MSLSNTSQILLRNIELLEANRPLWVNFSADDMVHTYHKTYPDAVISTYNSHFGYFLSFKSLGFSYVFPHYGAEYSNNEIHDLVILNFPKSKNELNFTLAMLASVTNEESLFVIVGENTSGIKSIAKLTSKTLTHCQKVDSARHCILMSAFLAYSNTPFNIEEWFTYYEYRINGTNVNVATLPGVFSHKGLDKGTELLLKYLPEKMQGSTLDFGCGAGVISAFIGKVYNDVNLSLVDVSALALASSKKTLEINQLSGKVFASDSLSHVEGYYNHIVTNPPFHQGTKTHYIATETFLEGVGHHMKKTSDMTVVANSFLQYQPIMEKHIGKPITKITDKGFKVYHIKKNEKE